MHKVRALLMGGQACVSYGAAEFSRDVDLAIASSDNLAALGNAMTDLHGEVIAVPRFEAKYLDKGHAVHFRCHHPECDGLRVDVMSRMRGVAPFDELRTPELLVAVATAHPDLCRALTPQRTLLDAARRGDEQALAAALMAEEAAEREADRLYWQPLRKELEQLRHGGIA